jgi:hypothetical protein
MLLQLSSKRKVEEADSFEIMVPFYHTARF